MSRTLLIIMADFLLLSLLALARFDKAEPAQPQPVQAAPDYAQAEEDLVDVLRFALEDERESREQLENTLTAAQEELRTREEQLRTKEEQLAQKEQHIAEVSVELQEKERQARMLAEQQAALQRQYASLQTNVVSLKDELTSATVKAETSQSRLQLLERDLREREEAAERLRQQLANLEKNYRATESEKQQLATQLRVSETETELVREQLNEMRGEVSAVRQEKAQIQQHAEKLAEGVSALASRSEEIKQETTELKQETAALTEEIRENTPLAPNTIFNNFMANRVDSRFVAMRHGLFGREVVREARPATIFVSDGTQTYAIFHVGDLPLELTYSGSDWEQFSGSLSRGYASIPVERLGFLGFDPRIVVVPVPEEAVRRLGTEVYRVEGDPYKFDQAVLIGVREPQYGEARFKVDPANSRYLQLDRSQLGLFSRAFEPSRGDLVFSKSGQPIGIMINNDYAAVLDLIVPAKTLKTGRDIQSASAQQSIAQMKAQVDFLPPRLR